jgi:hypothetical protein
MLHVVLEEVPLLTDVFSLFAEQGILKVRDDALAVLLDGGGFGDGGVEDLPHNLAEVESFLGGVSRRVILGFTRGLSHARLLLGLEADRPASESEEIARTRLAGDVAVCLVIVGKAWKLEIVVRAPPNVRRMSMVPWRYRSTFFKAYKLASVGDAWAEPRMLNAVETSGRVQ